MNNPSSEPSSESRWISFAILATCALGVALRAVHLDIPMRYDESVTFLSYASQGWEHVTTSYENPNNHIFHSLLVAWVTALLGDAPTAIRLPALVAGCSVVPLTAWVAAKAHGRDTAVIAAMLVATSPILIEFSTNARGYSLVTLLVLAAVAAGLTVLESGGTAAWLVWIEAGVLALYTLPASAIPWVGLTTWLAWGLASDAEAGRRLRALIPLLAATAVIGVASLALYWGIFLRNGTGALVANRFVAALPIEEFAAETPSSLSRISVGLSRGSPMIVVAVAAACAVFGLLGGGCGREWRRLVVATALAASVVMLAVRNWGEPRIWQWTAPLVAITCAIGAVELGRRLVPSRRVPWALAVAFGLGVSMTSHVILANPVRASQDTGVSPWVAEAFEGMAPIYREGDWIGGDFVSVEPLRYYLGRGNGPGPAATPPGAQRAWIVVDRSDSARAAIVRNRVARSGVSLDEAVPLVTAGDLSLYLFEWLEPARDPELFRPD